VGKRVQEVKAVDSQDNRTEPGHHPPTRRRPGGRKAGPAPESEAFGEKFASLIGHCFPALNQWLDTLPDPRRQDMCTYPARHLWWSMILTFLLRGGSRNAFDGDRNSGQFPANISNLCKHVWDEMILGTRKTVTCTGNAVHHAARVDASAVAQIPLKIVKRLIQMRLLDSGRLLDQWWMIAVDGTLRDRGHDTHEGEAKHRYVLTASLVGPFGIWIPLMSEFMDVHDMVRHKEDCELNAFGRLAERLHDAFPRLPICLLMDGLYPVKPVFDRCEAYGWKFIASLPDGRQPTAYDEAVQTMMMCPDLVSRGHRDGEDGPVDQTLRWTHAIPFGQHSFDVLFCGEISPACARLWVWVTNFTLKVEQVYALANHGGRSRQSIECVFNVEKNGGFGLEHTYCANTTASQNYHLMMQVAFILWQLLAKGVLHKATQACRKITNLKLVELLGSSLRTIRIPTEPKCFGQLRFNPSS